MNYNPLLMCDFYKVVHSEQYPKNITKIVSYFTPRSKRITSMPEIVMFGLQGFIIEYLIDYFNNNFFNCTKEFVYSDYIKKLEYTLGNGVYNPEKVLDLHTLGYLPIKIKALPEGTLVPMGVPMFEITNTHPDFAWLVNTLETLMSCSLWHTMISATVGNKYRTIVNRYYNETCKGIPKNRALGDFSMRGQTSFESAIKSSAGFCLSFLNTATVGAIQYLEKNYFCDSKKDNVAFGLASTEHSVMNSNYAVDGDEITFIKRLLTEIYPNNSFSMVSDSYDYWNLIENILPQCKKEILEHNGVLFIRGDSGDPVDITVKTVEALYAIFDGYINKQGYKVLNDKIRVIYGDAITIERCKLIYENLKQLGYSAENCKLGVGSFSMHCIEEGGILKPFTRDTYGIAIKATYCEVDGNPIFIYKDPKTDTKKIKKSQKGCCVVYKGGSGAINYKDNFLYSETNTKENLLVEVFNNGKLTKKQTLSEVRARLNNLNF